MLALQGLSSANAEVQSFCSGALLTCEALVHPRSTAAWPPAKGGAAAAADSAAPADVSYLGVPRFWSALAAGSAGSMQGVRAAPTHAEEELAVAAEPAADAGVSPPDANGHDEQVAGRHAGEHSSEAAVMSHLSSRQPALQHQDISMPAGSTTDTSRQVPAAELPLHAEPAAAPSQPPVQQDIPMAEAAAGSVPAAAGAAHEQAGMQTGGGAVQPFARTQEPLEVCSTASRPSYTQGSRISAAHVVRLTSTFSQQEPELARRGQEKAAPAVVEDISDSEGSLPSIDSGGKDSSDEE